MAELSPLQRWLHYVDEQLSPEAVDFLKLGLHSEFFRFYGEVQKLDKPSLIYYYLLERCMGNSTSKALKMYLHVMRGLGGTLRGTVVVNEAFGVSSTYEFKDPGLFDIQKASVNFKFFQCLLKISVKARKMALGDQLKKKFCKTRFLNMNYRNIQSLSELFIRLFQKQFIGATNTHNLVEALSKYKARVCLQILNSYHKSVGLQPIALPQVMEGTASDVLSSDPAHSMDDSSDVPEVSETRCRKAFYELDNIDPAWLSYVSTVQSRPKPSEKEDSDIESDTCIIESSETDEMITNRRKYAAKGQLGTDKIVIMGDQDAKRKSKQGYKICTVVLICLLLLSIILVICLALKVWMKLAPREPSLTPIMDGSTILLLENGIDSLFHKKVTIDLVGDNSPSPDLKNFDTSIKFYGKAVGCNHIKTDLGYDKQEKFYMTEQNISNFYPIYVLEGSTFNYVISSKFTNDTVSANYVDICMYSGTSYQQGRQVMCREELLREDNGQFTISRPGYVFFRVESRGKDVDVQFSLNVTAKVRTLQGDKSDSEHCNISATNLQCSIDLPLKPKFCLVAKFYPTTSGVSGFELQVKVRDSRFGVILAPSLIVLFVFLVAIVASFISLCSCKIHSTRSSTVTIV